MKLILASASPRRRELMQLAGYEYDVIVSSANEDVPLTEPSDYVRRLARKKAEAVFIQHPDACVVGADTIVYLDGRIIGKPHTPEKAAETLAALSGRTHTVYTGVAVLSPQGEEVLFDAVDVTFLKLSEAEIQRYVATGDPLDKAGAYGIQGPACVFVERICGNYFTVIGLPMPKLYRTLEKFGIIPTAAQSN